KLELPVDAHLPHDYVEDERQRLELYKRISAIRDAGGVRDAKAELADRFGPLPEAADRLLSLAALKAALRRWKIHEVTLTAAGRLRIAPMDLSDSQLVRVERLHRGYRYQRDQQILQVPVPSPRPDDLIAWVAATLRDLLAPAPKKR
ncbi:MAG: TRCF domain-containing protein, partial [Gaiellaceae bacterium]